MSQRPPRRARPAAPDAPDARCRPERSCHIRGATSARARMPDSVSILRADTVDGAVHYRLQVHNDEGHSWECLRRYSQFDNLRRGLLERKNLPPGGASLEGLSFPQKVWIGGNEMAIVHERRSALERWLNGVLALCPDDHAVSRFLAPPSAQNGTSSTTDAYAHDVAGMKEDWVEREKVRALKLRLLADAARARTHAATDGLLDVSVSVGGVSDNPADSEVEVAGINDSGVPPASLSTNQSSSGGEGAVERLIREPTADINYHHDLHVGAQTIARRPRTREREGSISPRGEVQMIAVPPAWADDDDDDDDGTSNAGASATGGGIEAVDEGLDHSPVTPDRHRRSPGPLNNGGSAAVMTQQGSSTAQQLREKLQHGGSGALSAITGVVTHAVELLDAPSHGTPRVQRRRLEKRCEQLLATLCPPDAATSRLRWALFAAGALVDLAPLELEELTAQLHMLHSRPLGWARDGRPDSHDTTGIGGSGVGMSAEVSAALQGALTTLEHAVNGPTTQQRICDDVGALLAAGGPEAVAVVREALEHARELLADAANSEADDGLFGTPRRRQEVLALRLELVQAVRQLLSGLTRGLGLRLAGRGLSRDSVAALMTVIVTVLRASTVSGGAVEATQIAAIRDLVWLLQSASSSTTRGAAPVSDPLTPPSSPLHDETAEAATGAHAVTGAEADELPQRPLAQRRERVARRKRMVSGQLHRAHSVGTVPGQDVVHSGSGDGEYGASTQLSSPASSVGSDGDSEQSSPPQKPGAGGGGDTGGTAKPSRGWRCCCSSSKYTRVAAGGNATVDLVAEAHSVSDDTRPS